MAYIFEYSFLCKNLYQAKKIRDTLTTEIEYEKGHAYLPPGDEYFAQIGEEYCKVVIESHAKASGNKEEKNGWWVSVIPLNKKSNYHKWPSGGVPDEEKAEAEAFVKAMWDLIHSWDSSYRFIYASQGVEVHGFADEDHIHLLWNDPDHLSFFDHGAILGLDFFARYNCAGLRKDGWEFFANLGMQVSWAQKAPNIIE